MDFASVSKLRFIILSNSSSNRPSAETQYATQFLESVYRYLSQAFNETKGFESAKRKYRVILNLLILADSLEDVRLTEFALQHLDSEKTVIQYWAVHCLSNQAIIEQLNSTNPEYLILAREICERLKALVTEAGPEVTDLILRFAGRINIGDGKDLILRIADVRISRYANWQVNYELLDADVLKVLSNEISSADEQGKRIFGRRFAHLFSYIIQRYVKGSITDSLTDWQKQRLASVLVEVERSCVSDILGKVQVIIRRTLEGEDYTALLQEHSRLLGDQTRPGLLPSKLDFNYGNTEDGSEQIAPPELPDPPARQGTEG